MEITTKFYTSSAFQTLFTVSNTLRMKFENLLERHSEPKEVFSASLLLLVQILMNLLFADC